MLEVLKLEDMFSDGELVIEKKSRVIGYNTEGEPGPSATTSAR